MTRTLAAVLWAALAGAPPGSGTAPVLSERYDLDRPVAVMKLPPRLVEVSGLAFTPGGTLLAHDDEVGVVYAVDPVQGRVDRGFRVGTPMARDDFEGMAAAGERLFLISNRGLLYEFRRGDAGSSSPVRVTDTGLGQACEAEGLAYHGPSRTLLVACKTLRPQAPEVRIHLIPLDGGRPWPDPIRIPWASFAHHGHPGPVHPSGIDVDPGSGTLVLVAAREHLIFEADLDGTLRDVVALAPGRHAQPEGIAFGPDGLLHVADEGAGGDGRITVYGPRIGGGAS